MDFCSDLYFAPILLFLFGLLRLPVALFHMSSTSPSLVSLVLTLGPVCVPVVALVGMEGTAGRDGLTAH